MSNQFFISIVSQQTVDGQTETSQVSEPCAYGFQNGIVKITYEDSVDSRKITTTLISDKANKVTILRCGTFSSKLVLEKGVHHTCTYGTKFGNIEMGVFTHEITHNIAENSCQIALVYSLDIGGNLLSDNQVIITVKEKNDV